MICVGDIIGALGGYQFCCGTAQCTDDIPHTNHDAPFALVISPNELNTSPVPLMHYTHVIQAPETDFVHLSSSIENSF